MEMRQDTYTHYSDTETQLTAIKNNDEFALKTLYQNNFQKVEKYVLSNNGTIEQAKDIFQEAFIAVWRNIQLNRFVPENASSLEGYLYQIAKNKWIDSLRAGKKNTTIPIDQVMYVQAEAPALTEEDNNYLSAIKHNLKLLGETCRDVLTRFYYEKEHLAEIASTYGWTEATARNNKYRCLQRLRKLIQKK